MAIEIGHIRKPFIYLEGQAIYNTDYDATAPLPFGARVDHAKDDVVTSSTTIGGVTLFNQENILTFNENVRIVIDTNVGNEILTKPSYQTQLVEQRDQETTFEGSNNGTSDLLANKYAETWFTITGKTPVRGKAYLYKYLDTSAELIKNDEGLPNDWSGLGFLLGTAQTGSDLITLKAVTYYQGKKSRVAIAKFKIARGQYSKAVGPGVPLAK